MAQGRRAVGRLGVGAALAALGFAACGGLDDRKVTRGAESVAGSAGESAGSSGSAGSNGSGGSSGEGGSSSFAGSGFEGGAPSLDGAPRVVAVLPGSAEADVDPLVSVRVRFSEGLDEATVTSDSVQLFLGDAAVPGALAYQGGTVTFEPDERLALLAEYEVRVSQAVTDVDGQPLEAAFSSRFSVREGAWTSEEPIIETLAADKYWPGEVALGTDAAGNVLTAWVEQGVNAAPTLSARWLHPGDGWQRPTPLHTPDVATNTLFYVSAAVSPTGDAVLAWFEQSSTGYTLWAARYVDSAWGKPERAEGSSAMPATSFPPGPPLVAINGERTLVAWLRQEFVGGDIGTYYYLEGNDAEHGRAFGAEAQVVAATQGGLGNYLSQPALGMDAAGNALLVFNDIAADVGTIHYSKYAAGTGDWSFDLPITGASPARSGPYIAMSAEGAAVVVYDAGNDLTASSYTKARGFAAPTVIDELDTQVYLASAGPIVTDGRQFLLTWQQPIGTTNNTYAAISSEGTWSSVELVSDGDVTGSGFPVPIADVQGNLTIVWSQGGPPTFDVFFARRPSGASAWQAPQELSVSTPRPYGNFRASAASNGMIGLAMPVTYQSASSEQRAQPFFALFH